MTVSFVCGFPGAWIGRPSNGPCTPPWPRHPLLTAKVEIVGRRRLRWSVVEDPAPVIVWEESPVGGRLPPATHLDLRREIGIRFHVRIDPAAAASDLTIQFHHACCDAAGIASFIRDLLVVYAAGQEQTVCACRCGQSFRRLDPALLAGRGPVRSDAWKAAWPWRRGSLWACSAPASFSCAGRRR